MTPKTIRGFAVLYALLFFVVIGSGLGAYATYSMHGVKHDVATVKASLGDQNLTRLASKYVNQRATAAGLSVVKMRVTSVKVDGDNATVYATATFSDGVQQVTQHLKIALKRGVWNAETLTSA